MKLQSRLHLDHLQHIPDVYLQFHAFYSPLILSAGDTQSQTIKTSFQENTLCATIVAKKHFPCCIAADKNMKILKSKISLSQNENDMTKKKCMFQKSNLV